MCQSISEIQTISIETENLFLFSENTQVKSVKYLKIKQMPKFKHAENR